MIRGVPKPEISPDFTIEDIHKIREWNHERRKGMTPEKADEDIRNGAERFKAYLSAPLDPAIKAEANRRMAEVRNSVKKSKEPIRV